MCCAFCWTVANPEKEGFPDHSQWSGTIRLDSVRLAIAFSHGSWRHPLASLFAFDLYFTRLPLCQPICLDHNFHIHCLPKRWRRFICSHRDLWYFICGAVQKIKFELIYCESTHHVLYMLCVYVFIYPYVQPKISS